LPSSRPRSGVAKALALPRAERRLLVEAAIGLPVMGLALRAGGYQRAQRVAARLGGRRPLHERPDADDRVVASARMLDAAVAHLPGSSRCLSRSLVLWTMLRRQGIDSEIVIGVRPGGAPLDAHAWVERHGQAIGDDADHVGSFGPLHRGRPA
jgi:hypothetical protein